jgi:mono/diheme cytochrome c family protein
MNAMLASERQERNTLTASEFRDIIAYLYYLNYNSETGEETLGQEVFFKKGCSQCHTVEPLQGSGKPGRPVYEMGQFQVPVNLAVAVWNHGTRMFQTITKEHMRWPEFQDKEVTGLVAFIRSRNAVPRESDLVLPGDPRRGQALFESKSCVSCHRPATQAALGPDFSASGRATSLSSLIASLWNHYPKMSKTITASGVSYSKIERDEMADILAYVYWLKATGIGGNSAVGRSLYQSKQCAACHSPSGQKSSAAPSLVKSQTAESAYSLLAAIWNHGPRMEALLRERNIPWPPLTGDEMRNLVAFFRK